MLRSARLTTTCRSWSGRSKVAAPGHQDAVVIEAEVLPGLNQEQPLRAASGQFIDAVAELVHTDAALPKSARVIAQQCAVQGIVMNAQDRGQITVKCTSTRPTKALRLEGTAMSITLR